jgi:hypothetical protein
MVARMYAYTVFPFGNTNDIDVSLFLVPNTTCSSDLVLPQKNDGKKSRPWGKVSDHQNGIGIVLRQFTALQKFISSSSLTNVEIEIHQP